MGLPVRRLVLATNENNVLEEFFGSGIYRPRAAAQTHATSSKSMDISRASNFERFVFDLLDGDPQKVRSCWDELARNGHFDLSEYLPLRLAENTPDFKSLKRTSNVVFRL